MLAFTISFPFRKTLNVVEMRNFVGVIAQGVAAGIQGRPYNGACHFSRKPARQLIKVRFY